MKKLIDLNGTWQLRWYDGGERGEFLPADGEIVGLPAMGQPRRAWAQDLELDELWVVYPGQRSYPLGKKSPSVRLRLALHPVDCWKRVRPDPSTINSQPSTLFLG